MLLIYNKKTKEHDCLSMLKEQLSSSNKKLSAANRTNVELQFYLSELELAYSKAEAENLKHIKEKDTDLKKIKKLERKLELKDEELYESNYQLCNM